jgi:1-aminocyclopropane-1-carboxylate deaminase
LTNETAQYTKIDLPLLSAKGIQLAFKREELLFPGISGNKYRKLKYNIQAAKAAKQHTLLTFGGAFSNHIAAVAYAGAVNGFKTIGVIRGEELASLPLNPTLEKAKSHGMSFHFVTREAYREKHRPQFVAKLQETFGHFYLIPEGGTNALAVKGCTEILHELDTKFTHISVAVGTGGTLSGLAEAAFDHQEILGFPALKGAFLQKDICNFTQQNNWSLFESYHFGGYAKVTPTLVNFANQFNMDTGIVLDPVYTAKMVFGVMDLIENDYFESGAHILMIHTGGLQAIEGMNEKLQRQGIKWLL